MIHNSIVFPLYRLLQTIINIISNAKTSLERQRSFGKKEGGIYYISCNTMLLFKVNLSSVSTLKIIRAFYFLKTLATLTTTLLEKVNVQCFSN